GNAHGKNETVAPNALQEIRARQVIQNSHVVGGFAHGAALVRWSEMHCRYASSSVGEAGAAPVPGRSAATIRTWTPSVRRTLVEIRNFCFAADTSALGITSSHTLPSTARNKS